MSSWGFLLLAATAGFAKTSLRPAGRWKAPRFLCHIKLSAGAVDEERSEMKKTLISMGILLAATVAQAQVTVPEPEYVGQVVFLTSDTTAVALQKEPWTTGSSSSHIGAVLGAVGVPGAAMLDKTKMVTTITGPAAAQEFACTTARFIIRAKDNDIDPTGCVGIFKYVVNKKKNRERKMAEMCLLSGTSFNIGATDVIFTAKKYGESSYLVEATFEPGEYAIDIQGSGNAMSTFRIIKPEEGKE